MEKKLTKLDALRILANAYHYLLGLSESNWLVTDFNAIEILQDKFHHSAPFHRAPRDGMEEAPPWL
jgi:hypothetical protein